MLVGLACGRTGISRRCPFEFARGSTRDHACGFVWFCLCLLEILANYEIAGLCNPPICRIDLKTLDLSIQGKIHPWIEVRLE